MRYLNLILSRLLLVLVLLIPSLTVRAEQPVVYGVFFYTPTCPHCHLVLEQHWPGIQARFGERLQVLMIDASTPAGGQMLRTAVNALNIPSGGVPMLIIGSRVLIGSRDIPLYTESIVQRGLESGGIPYPRIPGIAAWFETADLTSASAGNTASPLHDPANLTALVVLIGLLGSLLVIGLAGWELVTRRAARLAQLTAGALGRWMALTGSVIGIGLTVTLVAGSLDNPLTLLIALAALFIFGLLTLHLFRSAALSQLAGWLIPLLLVTGLLVAGYLTYTETTLSEATCGVIGDCNAVQQSPYARIFGIPVGLLGLIGYSAMLAAWALGRFTDRLDADALLFGMALAGVAFSAYLTFLEPFVIGASCAWCLTSAVLMALLLWLSIPAGWDALSARFAVQRSAVRRQRR